MAETYTTRTLREIVRIVASRFIGMLIILVVIVGGVTFASLYSAKWYRSVVQLEASPSQSENPLESRPTGVSLASEQSLFVMTQAAIIRSNPVLATALMCLDEDMKLDSQKPELPFKMEEINAYISANPEEIRKLYKRVSVVTPGGPDATFTRTFKIRVDWPEKRSPATLGGKSRQVAAQQCQQLANNVMVAYLARFTELEEKRATAAYNYLKGAPVDDAKARLDKANQAEAAYATELGADLPLVMSIIGKQGLDSGPAAQVQILEKGINLADAKLATLRALKEVINKELAKKNPADIAVPDEVIKDNSAMTVLQQSLTGIRLKLNELEPKYEDAYEPLRVCKAELAAGYQDLRVELVKQEQRISGTIAMLEAAKADAEAKLVVLRKLLGKLGGQATVYSQLQEEVLEARKNYNKENDRATEAGSAMGLAKGPRLISILSDATLPNPDEARRPIIWLNILISIIAGLVLAFIYAFISDHFDHTIKSVDDAERYLGTPVLASVPKMSGKIIGKTR
jgi:capsular polysaccharide biosynthesis protein